MSNIDWKFIHLMEGYILHGYVPKDRDAAGVVDSGVTIGAGFDLGQQTRSSILLLGLPSSLSSKLVPYAGIRGASAIDLIRSHPLVLSDDEGFMLSAAVEGKYAKGISDAYTAASDEPFESLTTPQQTVIMSVGFQYGNLSKRCPRFWALCVKRDWRGVVKELRNFGDGYTKRRTTEADYLERGTY